jgi:hypothetical protein
MPSIDERVVSAAFENAKFEAGVAQTMNTLAKLNTALAQIGTGPNGMANIERDANKVTLNAPMSALDKLKAKFGRGVDTSSIQDIEKAGDKVHLSGPARALDKLQSRFNKGLDANKAFADIEKQANQLDLSGVEKNVEQASGSFSVLSGAAAVAFGNIATRAAAGVAKGVAASLNAIKDGFSDYELKITSTQTIMSGTGENIGTVTKYLKDMDTYADRTIYNLRDMTGNIGKFTNAGVKLPVAVGAMKGIANLAALSGANAEEASRSMYNLGQAIGQGKVRMADWRSVDLANMGTKEFKEQLIEAALAAGTLTKAGDGTIRSAKGNIVNFKTFGATLQDNWLTSEALTKTLNKYSDETTDLGKRAYAAASDVKSFSMMMSTLAAAAGTAWTDTFDIIIGNLPEATKLWTGITTAVSNFLSGMSNARNKALQMWKDLGGRTLMIQALKDAFGALFSVLGTIGKAFREVFPRKTGQDLMDMTKHFAEFTANLKPGKDTLENLKRTFAGVFAVLHIGWTIVKDVGKVIFDLLGIVGKGSGGFLNFTGGIGDFLVSVDKAISKGNALGGFFKGLENILRVPIELIKSVASAIFGLFGGFDGSKADEVGKGLDTVKNAVTPLEKTVNAVKEAWKQFSGVLDQFKTIVDPWFDQVKETFSNFGDVIADGIKNANFDKVLLAFQTTFLGGIFLTLKKAIGGGKSIDITGGIVKNLTDSMGALTGTLVSMQKQVQAATLFTIAAAVLALAAGIKIISTIDPKRLAGTMTTIAVGLGELGGALKIIAADKTAVIFMPIIATSMFVLAGAIILLAAAMKIFATMQWEEIGKGLAGVLGSLVAVGTGIKAIGAVRLIPIAAGLLLIGVALNVMAVAMKIFAELSWEEIGRGLAGVLGSLLSVGAGLELIGPSILLVGPGLVAAAIGMTLLAGAVSAFGAQDPKKMLSGILGLGVSLATLGAALWLMPPTLPLMGAGLILVGAGVGVLAGAMAIMGNLKIGTLVKAIAGMAAALVVLSVGLLMMVGTLPGSLALLGAAAAFAVLGPALAFMGVLPWGVILKGLAAMALSMGVIAVVGIVAAPALLAMGAALVVLGLGLTLIGTAIYIAAKGLALLGENGAKGIGVLVTAITAFVALLPSLIINFVKGLVAIIEEVAKVAPKVVVALGLILDTVIAFIAEHATQFGMAVGVLIDAILEVIVTRSPAIIAAGFGLMVNFLTGIANNIGPIVTKAGEIITKFLNSLTTQAPRIVAAGARLLAAYLLGIANNLGQVISAAARVVTSFLSGVTKQLPGVISKGAALIITFLNEIRKHVPDFVKAGGSLIVAVINGIGDQLVNIIRAGSRLISKFINGIAEEIPRLADQGAKAVIKFLNGTAKAIDDNEQALWKAGANLARAIIHGMADGLLQLDDVVVNAAKKLADKLPHWVRKVLGIHSPSTVFAEIGKHSVQGLADGLDGNHGLVTGSAENLSNGVIGTFKDMFQIQSPSKVLKEIGKEVGHGFRDGLDGSVEDIKNSFASLREKINTEMANQRQAIKDEKNNLADLQKQYADKLKEIAGLKAEKKPDKGAIKQANEELGELRKGINSSIDAIAKYKDVLANLKGAKAELVGDLQGEKGQLIALSKEFDTVSAALDAANQALVNAKQERDNAIKSYTDQFSQLPDWDSLLSNAMAEADMTYEELAQKRQKAREEREKKSRIDQVALYKQALQEQIEATKRYQETLAKLRELGLDDATYKKLLSQGLAGQDFASQLLGTGKAGVDQINKMDAELLKVAGGLATDAATSLYQAGVNAAQGLVDGLKAKKAELAKAMDVIADAVVARIKSALGIRSPSKVFGEIGKNAADGLAKGLTDSSKSVGDAASGVGDDAAKAMTNSLANISDKVGSEIDTDIKITPVLDLSQVKKDAKNMPKIVGPTVVPITAARSYTAAAAVSSETTRASVSRSTAGEPLGMSPIYFEQNNYSPKALSDIEVYRQTNNLLSNVKRGLGLPLRAG